MAATAPPAVAPAVQTSPPSPRTATTVLDITVLMGGPSAEREVSLNSGRAVSVALRRLGHRVRDADIDPDNVQALDHHADLVFIALHGTFGEDGQLQDILERRGLPYVGSDAASSRTAMDKVASKRRFRQAGLPTPDFEVVTACDLDAIARRWALPAVIKPIDQGSSVDTFIVDDRESLLSTLGRVVGKYGQCMLERYVRGPELTVGILGETALPVCEIRTPRQFYDYTAKYLSDTTEYIFEPPLSDTVCQRVQDLALAAHCALGCRDFSRVDFMLDADQDSPQLLEVNTIPGFTDHSLLPKAAARIGIDFDRLCRRIVELALRRS